MNSFFKGLIRGLLAIIPICLIVCVLFAGQRLMLTDRTSVSSRNAGSDVDSVSAEQTVSDKRSSEDTALSPSDISAGGSRISHGGTSQNAFRSDDTTISIDSGNTAISNDRSKSDNIRNSDAAATEPVLAFVGDMLFTENTLSRYHQQGISSMFSEELLSAMTDADLFMVNEEFPFSTRGEAAADKQFTFRVDPSYVRIFQEIGVDVATVANNHALDFGVNAFTDSLDTLDQAGIARVGGGRTLSEAKAPVIRTVGDSTVGILGASRVIPVSSWTAGSARPGMFTAYDQAPLLNEISDLSSQCDYTVVYLHWGIEKDEYPQEYQRKLAYACIDAGADLVVGSHPHVLQGFETYKGKLIAYSLGNFLFSNSTNPTVLLQVHIKEDGTLAASLIPCTRVNGQIQKNTAPAALFSHLTELSYGVQVTADSDGNGQITAF